MTVGALGPPGKRVFYLQACQDDLVVSLKLEKEQVLFLAGGLNEVLADLAGPSSVPAGADLELEQPVQPEWAVGSMQLAYDASADRIVLIAREVNGRAEDEGADLQDEQGGHHEGPPTGEMGPRGTEGTAVARIMLTREQAAGVIEHGKRLLRGGRPPCPLCGYPLGEEHSCPKTNGHRSPSL